MWSMWSDHRPQIDIRTTGPNHGIRLILPSFLKTVVTLGPPISAVRRSGGPLGRKVVTPNPPLSAVGGAQRGVGGHNFSTQWSHCFGFGPSRCSFLVWTTDLQKSWRRP